MGVHNRTFGPSEQRHTLEFATNQAMTTGETGLLNYVPYPCVLERAQLAAFSVESDVNLLFTVSRVCIGQGMTTFNLGTTFVPVTFGTSGVATSGVSLPAAASTLMLLMPNDVLGYVVGGGTTAGIFGLAGAFVVKPLQDIKTFLGFIL